MLQETYVTKYFIINICMVIINLWILQREGIFLKCLILIHLQMNTGQLKYWTKVLAKLVLEEPFQWVSVYKQIHSVPHGYIFLSTILQIITKIYIHTCGKQIFHHGINSTIFYSTMVHTSSDKHIILVLATNLFD